MPKRKKGCVVGSRFSLVTGLGFRLSQTLPGQCTGGEVSCDSEVIQYLLKLRGGVRAISSGEVGPASYIDWHEIICAARIVAGCSSERFNSSVSAFGR